MQQYIPLKPIPIRDRASIAFIEKGRIDVQDGAFVLLDKAGVTQIPVGGLAALMLEPGTRITHAAIKLAAQVGCLVVWVGEGGVRLYAAGQPGGASAAKLLYQAKVALDDTARLAVVREMYARRFGEPAPERRSIEIEPYDGAVHVVLGQRRSHETTIGMPDAWIAINPADARRVVDDMTAALREIEAARV